MLASMEGAHVHKVTFACTCRGATYCNQSASSCIHAAWANWCNLLKRPQRQFLWRKLTFVANWTARPRTGAHVEHVIQPTLAQVNKMILFCKRARQQSLQKSSLQRWQPYYSLPVSHGVKRDAIQSERVPIRRLNWHLIMALKSPTSR